MSNSRKLRKVKARLIGKTIIFDGEKFVVKDIRTIPATLVLHRFFMRKYNLHLPFSKQIEKENNQSSRCYFEKQYYFTVTTAYNQISDLILSESETSFLTV